MAETPAAQPENENLVPPDAEEVPRHKRRKVRAVVGELNLTSMIDVVFQLLIYFIITVNFVIDEGVIMTDLPEVSQTPKEKEPLPPIKIGIRSEYGETTCVITFNDAVIPTFTALRSRLEQDQNNPSKGRTGIYALDHAVKIEPTKFVRWQYTLNAFNAALRAGYTNVSFGALPGNE